MEVRGEIYNKMRRLTNFVALLMVIILPSSVVMATAPSAILYANGPVSVNGTVVVRSTSVFDGDRIVTRNNAAGTLSMSGTAVLVQGDTAIVFGKAGLQIHYGGASIKTTQGMAASVGDIQVVPLATAVRYRVVEDKGVVNIVALEGNLTIQQGSRNLALAAGNSIILRCGTCNVAGAAASAPPAPAPPVTPGTESHETRKGLIIGLVGTGTAAGIAAAVMSQMSQSPAGP